jgi:hypothetical protein
MTFYACLIQNLPKFRRQRWHDNEFLYLEDDMLMWYNPFDDSFELYQPSRADLLAEDWEPLKIKTKKEA